MSTPRKCLLALLPEQLTPMMQRTVRNTQIACNLRSRLLTRFRKLDGFYLKFSRKGSLGLLHGPFPFCGGPLFQVSLPHFPGSRPEASPLRTTPPSPLRRPPPMVLFPPPSLAASWEKYQRSPTKIVTKNFLYVPNGNPINGTTCEVGFLEIRFSTKSW